MPLVDAMRSQRAIRRLHFDPVDWDLLREVLDLALKAPTSSNSQDWIFVVVSDDRQKKRLGDIYRAKGLGSWIMKRGNVTRSPMARQWSAVQWQFEHFDQVPVFVIPCYRRNVQHRPVGWPQVSVSSFYGSVFPAVQNLLLACRAVGLGASLQTIPLWFQPGVRHVLGLPRSVVPVCIVPIGWAKGRYGQTQRPNIEEVVHIDRYGNQPYRANSTASP